MRKRSFRHTRKKLLKSVLTVSVLLLLSCILACGIFMSNLNRLTKESIVKSESLYLDALQNKVGTQLELIKKHGYTLAGLHVPFDELTELSSSGIWIRSLMEKLLLGNSGYISSVSIELQNRLWSSNYTPFQNRIGSYSLFELYCSDQSVWPYPIEFRAKYTDNSQLNWISFNVDADIFGRQIFADKNTGRREFVINSEGYILFSNHNKELFQQAETLYPFLEQGNSTGFSEQGEYYAFVSTPDYWGFQTVSLVPRSIFARNFAGALPYFFVLLFGLLILSLASILFIVFRFYRPIKEWVSLLSLYQGQDIQGYENELHFITNSIKKIGSDIQNKNAIFQRLSKIQERQIAVQQHQIRYHFLFNSLENIKAMSIDEMGTGNDIEMSLIQLNAIISESMKMAFVIPLAHEIRLTRNYLGLMQTRFPNVQVTWDVDNSLLTCCVFKFSMQPMIENCYKHAFLHSQPWGKRISIRIFAQQEDLMIEISDNGAGIDPEKLGKLNRSLNGELPDDQEEHIGIYNVQARIRMLFGPGYGLSYSSSPEGTVASIRYPLTKDNPLLHNTEAVAQLDAIDTP